MARRKRRVAGPGSEEDARLIAAWIAHAAHASEETAWASDDVTLLMLMHPERGWPLLLRIVDASPDAQLDYIGAGPLESLLATHGSAFGSLAAEQARRDPRLRTALSSVWLDYDSVPAEVAAEFTRLTGGRVLFFGPDGVLPPGGEAYSPQRKVG